MVRKSDGAKIITLYLDNSVVAGIGTTPSSAALGENSDLARHVLGWLEAESTGNVSFSKIIGNL